MEYRDIHKKLGFFFSKKEVSKEECNDIIKILNKIKQEKPFVFALNMGKIMLKQGNFSLSKNYLLEALKLDDTNSSIYYHLYKVSVEQNEFQIAQNYLKKWKQLSEKNNKKIDISLFHSMLELYLDMENDYEMYLEKEYHILESDYFGIVKMESYQLKNYHKDLIKAFQNKNFNKMQKIIYKMNHVINQENIAIEVQTILKIVKKIIKKEKEQQKLKIVYTVKECFGENICFNQKNISLVILARCIYKTIPKDIQKAEKLYSCISQCRHIENYSIELKCLKNMIAERKQYLELSLEQQKQYDIFKSKGSILYREYDLQRAYDYYLAGLFVTNHNVFNYYLGKICYKKGNFNEACKHLETYIEHGGEKLSKSLLYLSRIYRNRQNEKKYLEYVQNISQLSRFFEENFEFLDTDSLDEENDYIKNREMKKNTVSIESFEEFKEESTSTSSNSVKKQLLIIKNLILNNQDKQAEKLLDELERIQCQLSYEDKKRIQQFKRNKKLYRAKR